MAKLRVYELAQDLGIENKELLERLEKVGIEVKNHMSSLEAADVEKIKSPPAQDTPTIVKEERVNSGIIRRRKKKETCQESDARQLEWIRPFS